MNYFLAANEFPNIMCQPEPYKFSKKITPQNPSIFYQLLFTF